MTNAVGHNILIAKFNKGDQQAFRMLFDKLYAQIFYFTQQLLDEKETAEEIVNDTFHKLFEKYKDFDSLPAIRAFLYITARNACFNYLEKTKRENSRSRSYKLSEQQNEFLASQVKNMDEEAAQVEGEVLKAMHEAIETLPEGCKTVIQLIYFHGLKRQEVAERLNLSPNTVRNQGVTAMRLLRARLKDFELAVFIFIYLSLFA